MSGHHGLNHSHVIPFVTPRLFYPLRRPRLDSATNPPLPLNTGSAIDRSRRISVHKDIHRVTVASAYV